MTGSQALQTIIIIIELLYTMNVRGHVGAEPYSGDRAS